MSARSPGQPPPQSVIIRARPTGALFCGFWAVLWAGILVGIESGNPPTEGDRIAAGVIFGLLSLLSVGTWFLINRLRRQLEIRRIDIACRPVDKATAPQRVNRAYGDALRILPKFKLYGKARQPRLVFLGRGDFIELDGPLERGFPPDEVRRACEAHGWPFDGDSSLAVKDVQIWLHHGRSVEAVQLLQLFGPFPDVACDDAPQTALAAAVFEDVGDNLLRRSRSNATDAYRRAAAAQRVFAGYARSADESAARAAEGNRIEAKAQA